MRRIVLLVCCVLVTSGPIGCVSPSREGLPPDSPFGEPVVLAEDLLPQGIAVGDVSATGAIVWVRTNGPAAVRIEWAKSALWDTVSQSVMPRGVGWRTGWRLTTEEADYTLSVPLGGLAAATRYRYRILIRPDTESVHVEETRLAAQGEFTTLPDAIISAPVTFAWSADLGGQGRCRRGTAGYPIFDVIRKQELDFFLFLGDTIYSDYPCPSPPNEPGADFVAATLDEYRARHRYQRGAPSLRRLLDTVPVYVMWDDHEVRNDFSGPFDDQMPSGRRALREYWPMTSSPDDPNRLYRSVRYGADLDLFILDTRQYRSRNADQDGPDKTMLGPEQVRWLIEGLTRSSATWKIIATTVPLSIPKGKEGASDGWASGPGATGFERERQVIVDTILGRNIRNVVFLAGDVHYVQANAYDPDGDGMVDFHEFVAGPLSAKPGRETPATETLHPTRLINEGGYHNFGLVRVSKTMFDVMIVDETGTIRFSHHLAAR